MNKVKAVTGYIPLDILNISKEQFQADGRALLDALPCAVREFTASTVKGCWLDRHLELYDLPRIPSARVVPADRFPTPEIMLQSNIIQNQKSEWLLDAMVEDADTDIFVWIDYGIFKQKPMTAASIQRFIARLGHASVLEIVAPGIQPTPRRPDPEVFCDRFCGSVVVVPRSLIPLYFKAMRTRAEERIRKYGTVEWEVNYLSDLEMDGFPVRQYQCWWDQSQLDNFPDA